VIWIISILFASSYVQCICYFRIFQHFFIFFIIFTFLSFQYISVSAGNAGVYWYDGINPIKVHITGASWVATGYNFVIGACDHVADDSPTETWSNQSNPKKLQKFTFQNMWQFIAWPKARPGVPQVLIQSNYFTSLFELSSYVDNAAIFWNKVKPHMQSQKKCGEKANAEQTSLFSDSVLELTFRQACAAE